MLKYGILWMWMLLVFQASAQQDTTPHHTKNLDEVNISVRSRKNYRNTSLSPSLRLNTPLLQLPQNVQAVSRAIIADQAVINLSDGLTRNISGVIRQEISNNLGPFMLMRGGQVASLRDGTDFSPIYRGPVPEDAAVIETVEFIKGPSGFMNNMGDPAGTFNVVTKVPEGKNAASASLMLGSYNFYRAAADIQGLSGAAGRLQYRLNVMGMKSRSFVQDDFNDRLLFAPVISYRTGKHSKLTAAYTWQKFSYALMSPIVMSPNGFGTLPRNFTISEKSLDPYQPTDQTAALTYQAQLNRAWSVTLKGSFLQNDNSGAYMWVTGVNKADPQVLLRNPKYDLTRSLVYGEQVFVNGKITTGALSHQVVAGADLNQKTFLADSYISYDLEADGSLKYYPLDVRHPVYGAEVPDDDDPNSVNNGNTHQDIHYVSLYALDEISLFQQRLRLTLGGRYTAAQTANRVSGAESHSSDRVFTPRIGVSYSLSSSCSIYVLSDRTFTPQAGSMAPDAAGTPGPAVKPKKGNLLEAGLKNDWMDGKWTTTLAVYTISRSGALSADPDNSLYFIQIGKSRSRGIDFDLSGRIARGLNAVINYAFSDSRITADADPSLVGKHTPLFVRHVQNTWLTYDLPFRQLQGFGISMGYQYQGGRGGRYAVASSYQIPDFFRLDGGLRWTGQKLSLNLVVNNLLDRKLVATPWLRNGLYYWIPQAPANFRLTAGYRF